MKTRDVAQLRSMLDSIMHGQETRHGVERVDELRATAYPRSSTPPASKPASRSSSWVDEYDAPLLNVIDDPPLLDQFRQIMRGF